VSYTQPTLLKRKKMRPTWHLHKAQTIGYIRALHEGVDATNCTAHIVTLFPEQASPKHTYSGEVTIFHLEGQVEFKFDTGSFELERYDMLFIPANTPYEYFNIGQGPAALLSIVGKYQEWPAKGTYLD